ncbi:MAG: pilus assembly protein PilP [Smithellaceae bacterium]|jgi:type IV pilus assembly protein PilP|nr:pilus assembly protein PilP [Smithellaceae bacterium]
MKRKIKKQVIVWFGIWLFLATVLGACGDRGKNPAAPQTPAKPQAVQIAPQTPPPTAQAAQPQAAPRQTAYSYKPFGKPDPFKPFVDAQIVAAKKAKAAETPSIFPLQRASVESFNVVGIIGDEIRRIAIVEDAAKKFYPLFVGTRVGLLYGKVTDILTDRVIVEELDGKKTRRVVLKLRKNQ